MNLEIERDDLLTSVLVYTAIIKRNEIKYNIHKNRLTGKLGIISGPELNYILENIKDINENTNK